MIARVIGGTSPKDAILWMEREMQKVFKETV
jgi:hypothetical protein